MVFEVAILSCAGTFLGAFISGRSLFGRSPDIENIKSIPRILQLASRELHDGILVVHQNYGVIDKPQVKTLLTDYETLSKEHGKYLSLSSEKKKIKFTDFLPQLKGLKCDLEKKFRIAEIQSLEMDLRESALAIFYKSAEFNMRANRISASAKNEKTVMPMLEGASEILTSDMPTLLTVSVDATVSQLSLVLKTNPW